jgi:hypothetical protein
MYTDEDTYYRIACAYLRSLPWYQQLSVRWLFARCHLRFEAWRTCREHRRRFRLWRSALRETL